MARPHAIIEPEELNGNETKPLKLSYFEGRSSGWPQQLAITGSRVQTTFLCANVQRFAGSQNIRSKQEAKHRWRAQHQKRISTCPTNNTNSRNAVFNFIRSRNCIAVPHAFVSLASTQLSFLELLVQCSGASLPSSLRGRCSFRIILQSRKRGKRNPLHSTSRNRRKQSIGDYRRSCSDTRRGIGRGRRSC